MPLSARIGADFGELNAALDQCVVKIKTASEVAAGAGRRFNQMVDQFDGTKIQREATIMVDAIDKLGGATTLTASEQAKVNVTLQAAIEKYHVIGQEVPPKLQAMADATKRVEANTRELSTAAQSSTSVYRELAATLGIGLGAGAAVMGVRELVSSMLAFGDQLQATSEKTGMSVEQVQKLAHVAQQSSTTLDAMAGSAQNLQQRLGDGDDSAAGAMDKLGVNAQAFLQLDTYQQMMGLSDAIRGVQDPTERAAIAADLFGKTWKEIMPALTSDMRALGESASLMSKETVAMLDDAGDAWDALKTKATVWTAEVYVGVVNFVANLIAALDKGEDAVTSFQKIWLGLRGDLASPLPAIKGDQFGAPLSAHNLSRDELKKIYAESRALYEKGDRELAAAEEKNAAKLAEYTARIAEFESGAGQSHKQFWSMMLADSDKSELEYIANLEKLWAGIETGLDAAWRKGVDRQQDAFDQLGKQTDDWLAKYLKMGEQQAQVGVKITDNATDWTKWGNVAVSALNEASRAAEMAGQKTASVLTSIGSSMLQAGINSKGNLWAILGAGAVSGLSALSGAIFKVEGRKVNDMRDAFIAAQGGFAALNEKARQAGTTLWALLNTQSLTAYTAAEKALTAALDVQNTKLQHQADIQKQILDTQSQIDAAAKATMPTWDTISKLASKYGIDVAAAGSGIQQMMVSANATSVLNEWQQWAKAGGDLNIFAKASAGSFQELVQQAQKFGVALPENMRGTIQSLIDQGLLLDASGKKITDLASLSFGPAIQTEQERLESALGDLTLALQGLTTELATLSGNPPVVVAATSAGPGGSGSGLAISKQASGGDYVVSRPTLFLAGEAGPERATFTPMGKAESGRGLGVTIHINALDSMSVREWLKRGGAREITDQIVPLLPARVKFRVGD
jgi:hypothetical protein